MLTAPDHDRLVSRIYAAAAGELPWTSALATVSDLFGVERNVINIADSRWRTLSVEAYGRPADHAAEYYAGEIYRNDPRMHCLQRLPSGTVYYDHMLFNVEAMDRNPWCQEAYRALGVKYQLGVIFDLPDGLIGAFAILPTERDGHASEAAIEAFRRVAPHMTQATALGLVAERTAATRSAFLTALSRKAEGVILLDRAGAPTFLNDAAQAILNAGDGLALSRGAFVTRRPPETRRITQLIQGALAAEGRSGMAPGGRALVSRPSGKPPYVVSVMPAPRVERFLAGAAIGGIVHLQDLAATRLPSHEALREVFGLSEREADLAVELVRCASLERAAANAGMALNTARNHLQSVSRKTGARGQTELVQLLGRLD